MKKETVESMKMFILGSAISGFLVMSFMNHKVFERQQTFKELKDNLELHNKLLEQILKDDNDFYNRTLTWVGEHDDKISRRLEDYVVLTNTLSNEIALIPEVLTQRSIRKYLDNIDKTLSNLNERIQKI